MTRFAAVAALSSLLLTSCAIGPNYKRPVVQTPAAYNGPPAPSDASIADLAPFDLFHDPTLTELLKAALAQNNDLSIAAERVLEARAQFGVARSNQFPSLDATAQFNSSRTSSIGSYTFIPPGTDLSSTFTQAGFSLSWELDLWGRVRRLKESARAQYLATEEARHGVMATVIADVTTNYLSLLELDQELEIAQHTREIGEQGLKLTELRHQRGAATGLDVRQAQELLYTATAQIAATERLRGETENALSVLLGRNPGPVSRSKKLVELAEAAQIPAGLPSRLIERRPDIREAENTLIAANAQIGAAEALYFPQISLTSFLGGQSRSLSQLFTGPARQWTIAPVADLSIFNAGRLRNNVHYAQATQREMIVAYRKAVQNGFREVSDSLIDHQKNLEQRKQQELFVDALRDADRLSQARYKGGLDSYLQVLDVQRNLFQGELALARLRRDELASVVELYRALGGGWQ
ncbi:MAG TPA: efflux transporter outer membrane subunit [Bryobacteraceae bacterium]|jgi:multidrug efflux system outer membrane protein